MDRFDLILFDDLAPRYDGGQLQFYGGDVSTHVLRMVATMNGRPRIENNSIICPCAVRYVLDSAWRSEPGMDFTIPGSTHQLTLNALPSGRAMLSYSATRQSTVVILFPAGDSAKEERLGWRPSRVCAPLNLDSISKIAKPSSGTTRQR